MLAGIEHRSRGQRRRAAMPLRSLAALLLVLGASAGAPADQRTTVGDKVAAYCEKHKGNKVGNGECTDLADEALAAAGAEGTGPDSPNLGDYTWGRLISILKWEE